MTVRTDDEMERALTALTAAEGASRQEIIRRAVLERYERSGHVARVQDSAERMLERWGDVLQRLGTVWAAAVPTGWSTSTRRTCWGWGALGTGPVRDLGLLDSSAARPRATVLGEDAYPTLSLKAAALLHSLVRNHCLVDGNERLAWLATVVFLNLNSVAPDLDDEAAFELVMAASADDRRGGDRRPAARPAGSLTADRPHSGGAVSRSRTARRG